MRALPLLLLAAALAASPVQAQRPRARPAQAADAPPAGASEPQRTTATFDDWTLRCIRPDNGPTACEIVQVLSSDGKPIAQTAFGRLGKGQPLKLTLLFPNNVLLTTAPRFEPGDGQPNLELTWRRCLPPGCLADVTVSDDVVRRLRASSGAGKITLQDGANRDVSMPVSPKGLGSALDALAKESS